MLGRFFYTRWYLSKFLATAARNISFWAYWDIAAIMIWRPVWRQRCSARRVFPPSYATSMLHMKIIFITDGILCDLGFSSNNSSHCWPSSFFPAHAKFLFFVVTKMCNHIWSLLNYLGLQCDIRYTLRYQGWTYLENLSVGSELCRPFGQVHFPSWVRFPIYQEKRSSKATP